LETTEPKMTDSHSTEKWMSHFISCENLIISTTYKEGIETS
jgi:hypothetical protein